MSKKYEIIEVNNVEVTVDVSLLSKTKELFFNATPMAQEFNKDIREFLRSENTLRYIDTILNEGNPLIKNREDLIRSQRGRYGGTWLHQELAFEFAGWCSTLFRRNLHKWVEQRLEKERSWQQSRLAAKTGYLPMSEAVLSIHEDPKGYHFSNEADLLNRIALGKTAKQFKEFHQVDLVRDALSAAQLEQMAKLQMVNAGLMEIKMPFQDRKKELTQLFQREVVKYE